MFSRDVVPREDAHLRRKDTQLWGLGLSPEPPAPVHLQKLQLVDAVLQCGQNSASDVETLSLYTYFYFRNDW